MLRGPHDLIYHVMRDRAGEDDVAREIAQEWAAIIDRVYAALVPPERVN